VASPLAILSPPSSRFRQLAPYCPISWSVTATPLPGWHATASHRVAPYCHSPDGTLLPLTGWHPTATHRLAPYCHSPACTLLPLTGWHPTATHRLPPYCYSPAGTLLLLLLSVDPSSVTPICRIALHPWLFSNALDRCNDLPDRTSWFR